MRQAIIETTRKSPTVVALAVLAMALAAVLVTMTGAPEASAHDGESWHDHRPQLNAGCDSNGDRWMYWSAGEDQNHNPLPDPEGWIVERFIHGHMAASFRFMGDDAEALQTYSQDWWDWTDDMGPLMNYTYQVTALDENRDRIPGRQTAKVSTWCDDSG